MSIDSSWTVVAGEPALWPGMRHCSNPTKGVLAALAWLLMSFGTSVHAADGPYVGIGGSLSILNDSAVTAPARDDYTPLNINATTKNGLPSGAWPVTPFPAACAWRPRSTTAGTVPTKWTSRAREVLWKSLLQRSRL